MDYDIKLNLVNIPTTVSAKKTTTTKTTGNSTDKDGKANPVVIHNTIGNIVRASVSNSYDVENENRVTELKDKICNGQYHIDYPMLADRLTSILINNG